MVTLSRAEIHHGLVYAPRDTRLWVRVIAQGSHFIGQKSNTVDESWLGSWLRQGLFPSYHLRVFHLYRKQLGKDGG